MNDEMRPIITPQVPSEQLPPKNPTKNYNIKKLLPIIFGLILVGAISYGSYSYGSRNSTGAKSSTNTNNQGTSQSADAGASSYHEVIFGDLDTDPKVLTKLAFPDSLQAIAYDNDRDSFRSLFGDDRGTFTYHGGHWVIGNPDDGDGRTWGYIGIMGIAPDWYSRNGFASYGGFNGDSYADDPSNTTINGYDFSTPKKKKASINKLISDTSKCAEDTEKGFTISGGFNVCYKPYLIKQAYAAYDPQVILNGYASINDVPYVLFGYIDVDGGLDGYSEKALDDAGNDFKAGKIPAPTQNKIDTLIKALKHSSVESK